MLTRRALNSLMLSLLAAPVVGRTPAFAQEFESPALKSLIAAAKAETELFTYGMPDNWANYGGLTAEVQKFSTFKRSNLDMGSAVAMNRMIEEKAAKNDLADFRPQHAKQLADGGFTADYKVSSWDAIPENQRGVGKDGSAWQVGYVGTLGFIVNKRVVKDTLKAWSDLTRPSLKNLITYHDPRSSGLGLTTVLAMSLATSGNAYNVQAGIDFLKKLHAAGNIAKVDATSSTVDFERGEVGVLVGYDYNLLNWASRFAFPTDVVIPSDGTLTSGGALVIAKNAPHPNTARLFAEVMMSKTGQSVLASAFVSSVRKDVTLPPNLASKFPAKSAYSAAQLLDYTKEAALSDTVKQLYAQVQ